MVLSGGDLATPITNTIAISDNVITVDPSATNGLSLRFVSASGEFQGWFVVPNNHPNYIEGAVLQHVQTSSGYFIGTSQGGLFQMNSN